MIIPNVRDRRYDWVGSWEVEPFDYAKLKPGDAGRTVIYVSHNNAEAGTISSWRNGLVFVRYSKGDTAAATDPADLVWGLGTVGYSAPNQT